METLSENNEEDTLELASITWNRVINVASKSGFREGITDGSMSVFQDGFDRGYKDAFKTTFLIGVYKGLACILKIDSKYPPEIENILSNTKKGICYLCQTESKESSGVTNKTIDEIENCQKEHSSKILQVLQDYFNPILKESKINTEFLNFQD